MLAHRGWSRRRRGIALISLAAVFVVASALPPASADETQSVYDAQWALRSAHTERLWEVSQGSGITVAVVDSGVQASHPDLRGRVVPGGDFGDGGSNEGIQDVGGQRGHGTEMASIIAGTAKNYHKHGLAGLAPKARILAFGVYRDKAPARDAVADAVRAAVQKGAQVVVLPAVGARHAEVASAVQFAVSRDVVVVAGNGLDSGAGAPVGARALPGVLTVAALDRDGTVWPAGQEGRTATLAAPGVDVLAAASDGTYWTGSDSAFAASWVAGVVALVRSANPDWSAAETIQKLIDTAKKGTGCGDDCRYGVVNAVRAVTDTTRPAAKTNPLLGPATPPRAAAPDESPLTEVPAERILLFVASALAALTMYVIVFAVFIRRQRGRREPGGAEG